MAATQLTGFEAAALRHADSLTDDELTARLAELADAVANDIDADIGPAELRELGCVALIAARRLEATR